MYTTIEADLENGRITGPESWKLPAQAHVFITLLKNAGGPWVSLSKGASTDIDPKQGARPQPVFGCAKGEITLSDDFDQPLDDFSEYMG